MVAEVAGGHGGTVQSVYVHAMLPVERKLPEGEGEAGEGMRDGTAGWTGVLYTGRIWREGDQGACGDGEARFRAGNALIMRKKPVQGLVGKPRTHLRSQSKN